MTAPRNRKAFEAAQALQAEICSLLNAHPPLAPPLTAKHVQPHLSRPASLRTIRRYMHAIRVINTRPPWPPSDVSRTA